MKDNVTGAYLVRESGSMPENYSLSVRNDNKVVHYHIKKTDSGQFYITQQKKFDSVTELVQHYSRDADGLCTPLIMPYPKLDLPPPTFALLGNREFEDKWEIEHWSVKLEHKRKSGEFSEVWEGTYNVTPVAVKVLIPGRIAVADFLAEAQIMKKLQHKKLLKLYMLCAHEKNPFTL